MSNVESVVEWEGRIRALLDAHDMGDRSPEADVLAWETLDYLFTYRQEPWVEPADALTQALGHVRTQLVSNSMELPADAAQVLRENAWALYESEPTPVQAPAEGVSPQPDMKSKLMIAFCDGLDGTELSEDDHVFVKACLTQAMDVVLPAPVSPVEPTPEPPPEDWYIAGRIDKCPDPRCGCSMEHSPDCAMPAPTVEPAPVVTGWRACGPYEWFLVSYIVAMLAILWTAFMAWS